MQAVAELRRVLKPGGILLVTVPFGRDEDHGWLQQFDRRRVERLVQAFTPPEPPSTAYFRRDAAGWQRSDVGACAACRFQARPDRTGIPAGATAVACIRLRKAAAATIAEPTHA